MGSSAIRYLSITNIVLFVVCISLMTSILVLFNDDIHFPTNGAITLDYVCHGLWSGVDFLFTGFLGLAASYRPKTPILVATLIFSVASVCSGVASSILSGLMTHQTENELWTERNCPERESRCKPWIALEYCLMIASILATLVNIIVSFMIAKTIIAANRNAPSSVKYS